jgi:hypothetical protein
LLVATAEADTTKARAKVRRAFLEAAAHITTTSNAVLTADVISTTELEVVQAAANEIMTGTGRPDVRPDATDGDAAPVVTAASQPDVRPPISAGSDVPSLKRHRL